MPFFSVAGSEFEEVFVGVGAARVRGMFEKARSMAPCILFIDEFDGMAKKRSSANQSPLGQQDGELSREIVCSSTWLLLVEGSKLAWPGSAPVPNRAPCGSRKVRLLMRLSAARVGRCRSKLCTSNMADESRLCQTACTPCCRLQSDL